MLSQQFIGQHSCAALMQSRQFGYPSDPLVPPPPLAHRLNEGRTDWLSKHKIQSPERNASTSS